MNQALWIFAVLALVAVSLTDAWVQDNIWYLLLASSVIGLLQAAAYALGHHRGRLLGHQQGYEFGYSDSKGRGHE